MYELHQAIRDKNLVQAAALLDAGEDINETNSHGYTPLHYAIATTNYEAVCYLIARGADLQRHYQGGTPLQFAEMRGVHAMIRLLQDNHGSWVDRWRASTTREDDQNRNAGGRND